MLKIGNFNATKEALQQYLEDGDFARSFIIAGRRDIGKRALLRQLAQKYEFRYASHILRKDMVENCVYDILKRNRRQSRHPLKPLIQILDIEEEGILRPFLIAGIDIHLMKFDINEWHEWASGASKELGDLKRTVISTSDTGKKEFEAEEKYTRLSRELMERIDNFIKSPEDYHLLLRNFSEMISFQYRNYIIKEKVLSFWCKIKEDLKSINIEDLVSNDELIDTYEDEIILVPDDEIVLSDDDEETLQCENKKVLTSVREEKGEAELSSEQHSDNILEEKRKDFEKVKNFVENIINHVEPFFYNSEEPQSTESGTPPEIIERTIETVLSQKGWIMSLLKETEIPKKERKFREYDSLIEKFIDEIDEAGKEDSKFLDLHGDSSNSSRFLKHPRTLYSSKVFEIKKFRMQEWLKSHPDKTDRDWLLETRCQNDEQREKIIELFNWVDANKNTLEIGYTWELKGFGTVFSDFCINDRPYDLDAPVPTNKRGGVDARDYAYYYLIWIMRQLNVPEVQIGMHVNEIQQNFGYGFDWKYGYPYWEYMIPSDFHVDKSQNLNSVQTNTEPIEFLSENELKNIIVDSAFDTKCRKLMICWCTSDEDEDKEYVGKDINNLIYNYPYIFETVSSLMSDDWDRKDDRVVVIEKIDREWGTNSSSFNEVSNIHQERNANIILLGSIEDRSYIPHSFLKGFEQFILLK